MKNVFTENYSLVKLLVLLKTKLMSDDGKEYFNVKIEWNGHSQKIVFSIFQIIKLI